MKKIIVLLTFMFVSGMIASAGSINFNFSYNGQDIAANGVFITSPIAGSPGEYLVTGITGQYNGMPITGLIPPNGDASFISDNVFTWPTTPTTPAFSYGGIVFSVDTLASNVNLYACTGQTDFCAPGFTYQNATNIGGYVITGVDASFSSTPEPGTLLTLGSGLMGVAGVIRRRLMA
jgi:hypothetical protein